MMRYLFVIIITLIIAVTGYSQEILSGLQINPVIKARAAEIGRNDYLNGGLDTIPVSLPFFDDFSSADIFPSEERWIDHFAFQNDDLPVYPINLGAMTMDAINDSGNMYPNAIPGPMAFIADYLTSRYIRLDSVFTPVPRALTPADSIYLSFFYQPQGRASAPQKNDSLILEFLAIPAHDSIIPGDTIHVPDLWQKKWYSMGMPLDTFYLKNNKYFVQVMIPVTNPTYLKKQFRFRFLNYVSLASTAEPSWQTNTAQWNIDNVYLNLGRNRYDTVYPELRFIYRPPSLLRNYESMPYPQYCDDPTNELKDTIDILMTNRDTLPRMSTYRYHVANPGISFLKTYNGGNYIIEPYTQSPYVTYQKFAHPAVPFLIPISQADSAVFLMSHELAATGSTLGDTIQALQKFYNYYAYDDGTPEASYGLSPAGSKLAYRFRLNVSPDTLRAVRMYFNRTLNGNSQQIFYLCVWNDNAGIPGDTIFSVLVIPRYADSLNKFVTYHIYPPLPITGTFYIGWIQTTGDNLSLGFDSYNNSQKEIFYNAIGVWNNSAYTGSLMIRPVIGKPIPVGIDDLVPGDSRITIYPNPCNSGMLHLRLNESPDMKRVVEDAILVIHDLVGQVRFKSTYHQDVDISRLANGLYFLELKTRAGVRIGISKFIVSR